MLKAELEYELETLKGWKANFIRNAQEAMKEILDDKCSEAIDPMKDFCEATGLEFPKEEVFLEVDYGTKIEKIIDENAETVDFEIIN